MSEVPVQESRSGGRSWIKWVVGGCGCLLVLGALAAVAIVVGVFGIVKRSDVYEEAVARAQDHPAATAALGEPIEAGWYVTGSVETSGPGGEASLSVPLEGPRGEGTLYVEATKRAGAWSYQQLELAVEDGERIDLLAGDATSPAAPPPAAAADEEWPPPAPPSAAAPAAGDPRLDAIVFSDSATQESRTGERFPAGTREIFAAVRFAGLGPADEVVHRWYHDDERIAEQFLSGTDLAEGGELPPNGWMTLRLGIDEGFAPGAYRVDVWLNDRRAQSGTFLIDGPASAGGPASEGDTR